MKPAQPCGPGDSKWAAQPCGPRDSSWPVSGMSGALPDGCEACVLMHTLSVPWLPPCASAASAMDAAAATPADKPHAAAVAPLAHGLQADAEAAAGRLQDACRSLLQVVWLTSVPRDLLEDVL